MKRFYFTVIISMIFSLCSFSQLKKDSIQPVRNISLELMGNGVYYSLKYENSLISRKFRYNIGLSYLPYSLFHADQNQQAFCIIPELNYLMGNKSSKLECGAGLTYRYWSNNQLPKYYEYSHILYGNFRLGYRYEKSNSKNIYKVGFVFFHEISVLDSKDIGFGPKKILIPWMGLSYGRKF